MSVDYGAIGRRIKEKRRNRRETQDMLAEALSVSVGYISQIERGVTKVNLDTLSEISRCLECGLAELLVGVTPTREDYLDEELKKLFETMDGQQKRLLVEIGWAILRCQ